MTDNTCIFCGAIIPEGRQVCYACSNTLVEKEDRKDEPTDEHTRNIHP